MLLFFGGLGNGINTRTVAAYDPAASKWYVNEPTFGSPASGGPWPTMTGNPPPDNSIANKWFAVAYNPNRHVWTFFDATNYPYDFDAVHNVWTKWTQALTLPPVPDANAWNGRSATFDPVANTYTLFEHTKGIFQYPDLNVSRLTILIPDICTHATVGQHFECSFSATGGVPPYTWSYQGVLPNGLSLSPGGMLSGIPTMQGQFGFMLIVTDSAGRRFSIPIGKVRT